MEIAEKSYRTILANNPEHEGALNLLGVMTMQKGNWGAAKNLIEKAIKAKPDYAEAYCNLGILLSNIENLEEAEINLKKAIEINPGYARAYCNIAHIKRKKGLWDEAFDNYEKAARYEPGLMEAWEKLLEIKTLDANDPLLGILERFIQTSSPNIPFFHYIMGKAYDGAGKYDEALNSYKKANELEKHSPENQMTPSEHENYINALIENFTANFFEERKDWGSQKTPVFVIGMPCSGQEIIETIASSHPKAKVSTSKSLGKIAQNLIEKNNSNPLEAFNNLNKNIINSASEKYLKAFQGEENNCALIDCSAMNIFNLWLANLIFPNAKIIFCERKTIDLCIDCYFSGNHPLRKYSVAETIHFHRVYKKLEEHWKNNLSMSFIEISFEEIVLETDKTARKITNFCGLEWMEKCSQIPGIQKSYLDIQKKYPEIAREFDDSINKN
jgi:tetratricopeptide (TPR) repeat protein